MAKDSNLLTYTLRWHGRAAVEPVYGLGTVVVEVVPRGARLPVIDALWFPGSGYEIAVTFESSAEPRQLSDEAKQSIRRKSLKRRIERDAPLFAASLYSSTVANNPDYFGKKVDP